MLDSSRSPAKIAYEAGYASETAFNCTVKRAYGGPRRLGGRQELRLQPAGLSDAVQISDPSWNAATMNNFYGQNLAYVHAEGFEALAQSAAETLLSLLGQGAPSRRVLDLGCGAGALSRRLGERGFSAWGLDQSPSLIALARQRMPSAEFRCGSILDEDLPSACAAAAVGEVLNYATVDDPAALMCVFQRVFRSLTPGGVFIFDLAGPGRVGAGRSFIEGEKWAVGMVATETDDELLRKISTFREIEEGIWHRSYEEHRLRLWLPANVTDQLRLCGYQVEQLAGYAGAMMPPSLHAYVARKPE